MNVLFWLYLCLLSTRELLFCTLKHFWDRVAGEGMCDGVMESERFLSRQVISLNIIRI